MAECPICIETFTATTRKEIVCPRCQYTTCIKCMKQHLLNQQTPNCMNCHVEFNREFIDMNMTKTFRTKELKNHREGVLLEREKSLLPATMPQAERERERREMKEKLSEINIAKQKLREEIEKLDQEAHKIVDDFHRRDRTDEQASTSQSQERRKFIKACVVEGCRGFLSSQYKCAICETWVCPHCHEIKTGQTDDTHECNPESVESVKLINKQTKPCPKCAVPTVKASGCSQIWCTECHATWDWNTGREQQNEHIHNPHYYEWVRRMNNGVVPRDPQDIPYNPCNDNQVLPDYVRLVRLYGRNERTNNLGGLLRSIHHMRVHNQRQHNHVEIDANLDLRINYILGDIDEAKWKTQLQQREKKKEFKIAKSQICDMLLQVSREHLNRLAQSKQPNEVVSDTLNNLATVIQYFNESMVAVHERFNSKAKDMFINPETWDIL